MAIDPTLFARLEKKLGLKRSQIYSRISVIRSKHILDTKLAALKLAAESGIDITRYATPEDLRILRGVHSESRVHGTADAYAIAPAIRSTRAAKTSPRVPRQKQKSRAVFVVHGRNEKVRRSMFAFLRAVGLSPIEWSQAVKSTKKASPYVGQILDAAFEKAEAVVVVLTPDDEARLRPSLHKKGDHRWETEFTGQARPNVLFEAGMAFGRHPEKTILVEVGVVRPFSDVAGRHVVKLDNSAEARTELADRLRTAGCDVNLDGRDWYREGDFELEEDN